MFRHLKKAYKKGTKLWNEIPKNQKSAKEKIVDLEIIERIIKNHWVKVTQKYIKKSNETERKKRELIESDKKNRINEWEWKNNDEINGEMMII